MLKKLFAILFKRPAITIDGINLRRWFIFYILFLIALAGIALLSFAVYAQQNSQDSTIAQRVWLLAIYLFYMSLCCTFFPAPTAWIVMLMASPILKLIPAGLVTPHLHITQEHAEWASAAITITLVATIGGIGTAIANLNEYHIWTFLLRFGKVNKIKETKLHHAATKWFTISPFALMTLISFMPIPVDVVRWLAISNRYPRVRFAAASFLGRALRYAILAAAATCLAIGPKGIVIIQAVLIGMVALKYLPKLFRAKTRAIDSAEKGHP